MQRRKHLEDRWSALFWCGFGGLIGYAGARLGVGSLNDPGSGFIFFWSGVILAALSMGLFVSTAWSKHEVAGGGRAGVRWGPVLIIFMGLLGYALLLERLGFLLSTFLLMAFLMRMIAVKRWYEVVGFALAVTASSYGLFEWWLKTRLPKGVFGF